MVGSFSGSRKAIRVWPCRRRARSARPASVAGGEMPYPQQQVGPRRDVGGGGDDLCPLLGNAASVKPAARPAPLSIATVSPAFDSAGTPRARRRLAVPPAASRQSLLRSSLPIPASPVIAGAALFYVHATGDSITRGAAPLHFTCRSQGGTLEAVETTQTARILLNGELRELSSPMTVQALLESLGIDSGGSPWNTTSSSCVAPTTPPSSCRRRRRGRDRQFRRRRLTAPNGSSRHRWPFASVAV